MTLFIPDWSNNNWSSTAQAVAACDSVIHREGYSAIIHKVSEGSSYSDPYWPAVRDWCNANGVPVIGYHYVRTGDPAGQAARWKANGGGQFAMLDFEDGSGGIGNFWAVVNAFNAAGVEVALSYIPHWYWQNIGSPDISQVPGLIASSYWSRNNYASSIYANAGGDGAAGWAAYGGASPVIWQFTDAALMAGIKADANAFRGSIDDLISLFTRGNSTTAPTPEPPAPTPGGVTVADAVSIQNALDGTDGTNKLSYRNVHLLRDAQIGDLPTTTTGDAEAPNESSSVFDHITTLAKILTRRYKGHDVFDMLALIGDKLGAL